MEVSDAADLVGALATVDLADASVLHRSEPLVLRVATSIPQGVAVGAAANLRHAPTVTMVHGDPAHVPAPLVAAVDLCLTDRDDPPAPWVQSATAPIEAAVLAQPRAALALAALLRTAETLDVWSAIAAESATYALLLGSDAHRTWLAERGPAIPRTTTGPGVCAERRGTELHLVLDRPRSRNAVDRTMRDALVEGLDLALADPTIQEVHLRGVGPDFSAGGDLHEFGTTDDPATALAVRLARHPGWAAHRVAGKLHAHLHGHCIGAGIEIPAFADHVTAHPDTRISLPELDMGLVPGAGGTVSLTRRIGRHRTAWLTLTGSTLTAAEALDLGLVDVLG